MTVTHVPRPMNTAEADEDPVSSNGATTSSPLKVQGKGQNTVLGEIAQKVPGFAGIYRDSQTRKR